VPDHIKKAVRVANDALLGVIDHLKPGATSKELNDVGRGIIEKGGYGKNSPYGLVHSIGLLECELPWFPVQGNLRVVEGMTVCIDVFLFRMDWGSFRIEDTLVVNRSGAERLTKFNEKYIDRFLSA
jgi:Xaa-Pro aminopeptidase